MNINEFNNFLLDQFKAVNIHDIKNKTYLFLPGIFVIVALLISQFIAINITSKLNKNIKRGDTILFCLDQNNQRFGLMRHYLEQGDTCNGADPLIKEIVAVPGDSV